MKRFDVCALGELLIDFTENGISDQGNPVMDANPGGAPCNVLAMLTKLGYKTAFIGKIGNDIFGKQLKNTVSKIGICTDGLITDNEVNTTLAFVHTLEDGDREFSFYRNPGADMMLNENDIDEELIKGSKIFHFGSLSMTNEVCERATKKAVEIAEKEGCLISFDPNLRENLWDSLEKAKEKISYAMAKCDILKISDNEAMWFTKELDLDKAIEKIKKEFDIPLILLSLGKNGSKAYSKTGTGFSKAAKVKTTETTGAGDTFCGCILSQVLKSGMKDYSCEELNDMLKFANAAAAIITTRKGALKVMPGYEEIKELLDGE